jgi:tetratricopeptide (TPR) repeat protein
MPQTPLVRPSRDTRGEAPARRPEPTPRSYRRSADEPLAQAPTLEDHLSSKPADSGRAALSPGIADAYEALQAGKLDQAESRYRAVLQADAQNVDALLGLATIAVRRGNAQQAIGFYEQALQIEPRNAVAQAGMIDIIGQADPQMSETHLKQLIAREPSAFLYFSLGNLYARQAAWPTAQAAYFQAYNLQPDNPDYAYNLAIGLEHLEQPKLALTYYRKALELSFQKGHANFDQTRVIERIGQLAARVD